MYEVSDDMVEHKCGLPISINVHRRTLHSSYILITRFFFSFQQRAKLDIADYETLQKLMKEKKLDAQRKSRITVYLLICFF